MLILHRPMIYTAPLIFWCGKIHYESKWEWVGPWKSRLFWALWNGIEPIGECHLGTKIVEDILCFLTVVLWYSVTLSGRWQSGCLAASPAWLFSCWLSAFVSGSWLSDSWLSSLGFWLMTETAWLSVQYVPGYMKGWLLTVSVHTTWLPGCSLSV